MVRAKVEVLRNSKEYRREGIVGDDMLPHCRTRATALTIAVGALFFERAFDQGADAIYEHINEGKLWKHIKHKYENKE